MIDHLPLDLFGDADEPPAEPGPVAAAEVTVHCQWCGAEAPGDAVTCPTCQARLVPLDEPGDEPAEASPDAAAADAVTPAEDACQWCGTRVAPEVETCPACGAVARPDPNLVIPGLNVPLPEEALRPQTRTDSAGGSGAAELAEIVIDLLLGGH